MNKLVLVCGVLFAGLVTSGAKAHCGHVSGETYYFQGTTSPDYFVLEHNFDVTDTTQDVVWALTYCVSMDDGQGGYQEYVHTRYFYQDAGSHLAELTGKAVDDNPTFIADFDRFPLNYMDLNFYTIDDPNSTSDDYIRFATGLNDDTIVATVSARLAPYAGTCGP